MEGIISSVIFSQWLLGHHLEGIMEGIIFMILTQWLLGHHLEGIIMEGSSVILFLMSVPVQCVS